MLDCTRLPLFPSLTHSQTRDLDSPTAASLSDPSGESENRTYVCRLAGDAAAVGTPPFHPLASGGGYTCVSCCCCRRFLACYCDCESRRERGFLSVSQSAFRSARRRADVVASSGFTRLSHSALAVWLSMSSTAGETEPLVRLLYSIFTLSRHPLRIPSLPLPSSLCECVNEGAALSPLLPKVRAGAREDGVSQRKRLCVRVLLVTSYCTH